VKALERPERLLLQVEKRKAGTGSNFVLTLRG
jgi:hypothetical protein